MDNNYLCGYRAFYFDDSELTTNLITSLDSISNRILKVLNSILILGDIRYFGSPCSFVGTMHCGSVEDLVNLVRG